MNLKNDGYVQFGVKNVCIPPDIQSFIIYFRMYCTETNTEYQDIRLIKRANLTLRWPAKILPMETVREHVIGDRYHRVRSVHFGIELKVLKVIKRNMARNDRDHSPLSPNQANHSPLSPITTSRRTRPIYYISSKKTKMQNRFKFKWEMDRQIVLKLRKSHALDSRNWKISRSSTSQSHHRLSLIFSLHNSHCAE